MTPDLLLLDLDGLARHWRDTGAHTGERRTGLPHGAFDDAYRLPEYHLAQLGVLTDEQWADAVRKHLIHTYGPHATEALPPWRADRGEIDHRMLDLIQAARTHLPVAILSNTTTALHHDLEHHGITDAFDAVFTSATLGVGKPAPAAYQAVCAAMNVRPSRVYFTDDEMIHIHGARHVGLHADLFTTRQKLADTLHKFGISIHQRAAA